jgi:hypothetical protein
MWMLVSLLFKYTCKLQDVNAPLPRVVFLRTWLVIGIDACCSFYVHNVNSITFYQKYSTGVTVQFRNEEESRAFHCAFEQWKKKDTVQGAALEILSQFIIDSYLV